MSKNYNIKIKSNKEDKYGYIIKDTNDIIIGTMNTLQLSEQDKRCDIKLCFYRENEYNLLKETLTLILESIFKDINTWKINMKVCEKINIDAFLDLGFTLEGVFNENKYYNGEYVSELSLGITKSEYKYATRYNLVELEGKRIKLRNFTPADSKILLDYYVRNKKYLAPFEPTRDYNFYTLETQQKILNNSYRNLMNGTNIDLGIFKKAHLIGKIKISSIVHGSFKSGMLGYSIDELQQGKGYMKETVRLVCEYGFTECGLHRLEASVLLTNKKSESVLLSCGFKLLGINEKYLMIDGKWQDHATYYLTKDYWESLRKE